MDYVELQTAVFTGRPLDPNESREELRHKVGLALIAMAECAAANYGAVCLKRLAAFQELKEKQ